MIAIIKSFRSVSIDPVSVSVGPSHIRMSILSIGWERIRGPYKIIFGNSRCLFSFSYTNENVKAHHTRRLYMNICFFAYAKNWIIRERLFECEFCKKCVNEMCWDGTMCKECACEGK